MAQVATAGCSPQGAENVHQQTQQRTEAEGEVVVGAGVLTSKGLESAGGWHSASGRPWRELLSLTWPAFENH